MDTVARTKQLAAERGLSIARLAAKSDVPYSTLKNTALRRGQLSVDTIERLCQGMNITLSQFFEEKGA